MKDKQISLGLKYLINNNAENFFLKKIHNYILELLDDAPNNVSQNLYTGLTVIDFNHSQNNIVQILRGCADNVSKLFPNPSHNTLPINLDIAKQRQFIFTGYSITNLQYDTINQTLIVETILNIEELFYIGTCFNKSIFIDLNKIPDYQAGNKVQTYSFIDSADILILKVN